MNAAFVQAWHIPRYLSVCLQMLTLNGGTSQESPVMGAMSDLDPNNAYTIMSYMSIKVSSSLQLLQATKAKWLSHLLVAVHLAACGPLLEWLHVLTSAVGRIRSAVTALHSACWLCGTCSSSGWLDNE